MVNANLAALMCNSACALGGGSYKDRMNKPIVVDLPHNLTAEEAKRRLRERIGELKDHIPGGSADVRSSWEGDRMNLRVAALGQEVNAHIDVHEKFVRVEVLLPPVLSFFGRQIEKLLRSKGPELLEDKSSGKKR